MSNASYSSDDIAVDVQSPNKSTAFFTSENFRLTAATGDGLLTGGGDNHIFVNCSFDTNGGNGANLGGNSNNCRFIRCLFNTNTNAGLLNPGGGLKAVWCVAYGNGGHGFNNNSVASNDYVMCLAHDNGDSKSNFDGIDFECLVFQCGVDGTNQALEKGIDINDHRATIIANRITNCATGLDAGGKLDIYGYNYFSGNGADLANNALLEAIPEDGTANTNLLAQAATWYNNIPTDDFNLQVGGAGSYTGDGDDTLNLNIGA